MSATTTTPTQARWITLDNGDEVLVKDWNQSKHITARGDSSAPDTEVQGSFSSIPIIDISRIYSSDLSERKACAEEIREVAHRIGFFYASGHGISEDLVSEVEAQGKRFFALPMEQKMNVWTKKLTNTMVGYHPPNSYNRENREHKEAHEAYNCENELFGTLEDRKAGGDRQNLWPEDLPGFREGMLAYHEQITALAMRLTRSFALALGLPEDYYDSILQEPRATVRVIHYPPQPADKDQVGIGAHTDFDAFTLLRQGTVPGLQVLNKSGNFIDAPPIPGTYVVNIGDLLQRSSNGYFKSTLHRVVNTTGQERSTIPFFFSFDSDKLVPIAETCVSESNPARWTPITSRQFIAEQAEKSKAGRAFVSREG